VLFLFTQRLELLPALPDLIDLLDVTRHLLLVAPELTQVVSDGVLPSG
jgi:hypothetical protein